MNTATKRAGAAVAALTLLLPTAGYFALRARARQAGERFIARAVELDAKKHTRTSHAPVPGKVGEKVAAVLGAHSLGAVWVEACTAVARGDAPLSDLTPQCVAAWERDRGWAVEVVQSSRAEEWSSLEVQVVSPAFLYSVRVAALELRKRPPDEGVELCVDAIALARDRALGCGLVGAMVAGSIVGVADAPCSEALAAASAEKREWARAALEGIEKSWPEPQEWVPVEMSSLAATFYPVLSEEQLARLPASARSTEYESGEQPSFGEGLVLMHAFPSVVTMFERVERAGALEPAKRDVELAAIELEERESWNPIRRIAAPEYSKFFKHEDERRTQLRKLIESIPADAAVNGNDLRLQQP